VNRSGDELMFRNFPEADWKHFKKVHPIALDRFAKRVLGECEAILADSSHPAHDRYIALQRHLATADTQMANAFNDWRRSTALLQLAAMHRLDVLGDQELEGFTDETQAIITGSWSS
jgi:hypothetical protein